MDKIESKTKRHRQEELSGWAAPPRPDIERLEGQYCTLERLTPAHSQGLFEAFQADKDDIIWDYLPYGPYKTLEGFEGWMKQYALSDDPYFFAIRSKADDALVGVASYLRIDPQNGSIEVGHINYSPLMQRLPIGSEVMYLMMRWAFEAGYRRYEWKCNALNARSRRAAQRFGFSWEGIFRQAMVTKGQNRDHAWFAVIDKEWQGIKACYEKFLSPDNFDSEGKQITSLSSMTAPLLFALDPEL